MILLSILPVQHSPKPWPNTILSLPYSSIHVDSFLISLTTTHEPLYLPFINSPPIPSKTIPYLSLLSLPSIIMFKSLSSRFSCKNA